MTGFYILITRCLQTATLLRTFGFKCISADKIYEYDAKKTSIKFQFYGESELNKSLDGQAIIYYARYIITGKKDNNSDKAVGKLDEETKLQINSCLNYLKVYEVLDSRLRENTYLTVHIRRHGKLWKIPNMGEDWDKFKKKFNITGIKTHKHHDRQII